MGGGVVDHRVTGKDVALRAGVTTATVSNVLNGKRNVGAKTRERVLAAIEELGYVPDRSARSLRQRTSGTIGVVIEKNLSNPRYGRTVEGMIRAADAHGYRITLCRNHQAPGTPCDDYLRAYFERQVDGIIFVSRDIVGPRPESIELITHEHVPFVALDCQSGPMPFTTIDFDYRGGAYEVTAQAIAYGARNVVYVRPSHHNAQEDLREEGVRAACEDAGASGRLSVLTVDSNRLLAFSERGSDNEDEGPYVRPSAHYATNLSDTLCSVVAGRVRPGDALISSWAGWSNVYSRAFPLPNVIFADLASDYTSMFGVDLFCEMPNFEAGERCVEALLDLIKGGQAFSEVLPVVCRDSRNDALEDDKRPHANSSS